ncbi:MAG TPA: glycosyltransferase family 4 protein [Tepidisphaeraceae bacterium]
MPDPAAVGQHLHEVAAALVRRGHRVDVICSCRGYDDPDRIYPARETIDGVNVRRYPLPFFSKTNMPLRLFGSVWAMAAIFFMALCGGRADGVIFSTSPPMVGLLAVLVASLKRASSIYWAMDLNPDQLVAMGKLTPRSPIYRAIESVNRTILSRSRLTVTLDRFMAGRLRSGGRRPHRVLVLPPWAPAPADRPVPHDENPFRKRHKLDGMFVVMYSGNHSPANPLDTIIRAAVALKDDGRIRFAFIGGGMEKKRVQTIVAEHALSNVLDLPYQPMAELPYSLGAADVHVVTLGPAMVGIVHPCKVYGAMAVGRPILFVGPRPSHVTDILDGCDVGPAVQHGDIDGCVAAIRSLAALPATERDAMGRAAADLVGERFDHDELVTRFCEAAERV